MDKDMAIEVTDVKMSFRVYLDRGDTMKDRFLSKKRRKYEKREVLKGISFKVKKGEAIGLIGHNGCGKSTTLKLLTKIMYPDSGKIEMSGRVSSLIELGAGFHPDMSGRENIYINAAIFGLTKKEIDSRLDDIIRFSELEDFIDNPVRTYSSGMYMRLAFSVAINVDADILLIDEILAVGDVAFQAKCFNRLREIKAEGTTIVIVSHSLAQIEQICDRSIWIHDGYIREEGLPRVVDPHYLDFMSEQAGERKKKEETKKSAPVKGIENGNNRWGSGEARIKKITIQDPDGNERNEFSNSEGLSIRLDYIAGEEISGAVVGIAIYRDDQTYIYGTNSLLDTSKPITLNKEGTIWLNIGNMPLTAGKYTLDFALHKPDGFNYDFIKEACTITIKNKLNEAGVVSIPHEWEIN